MAISRIRVESSWDWASILPVFNEIQLSSPEDVPMKSESPRFAMAVASEVPCMKCLAEVPSYCSTPPSVPIHTSPR